LAEALRIDDGGLLDELARVVAVDLDQRTK
jgi:hypothetical protein